MLLSGASDYLEQLEIIGRIRDIITQEDDINLPQICVIGDQSSGKSSFLSRLTGVSFPTAAKMCTKAATVVTCNKDPTLVNPKYEVEGWERPGSYVEVKSTAMAIQETQNKLLQDAASKNGRAWVEDDNRIVTDRSIKVRVTSPSAIDIIIVDLPGIQHAGNTKDAINALIEENIRKPETLNLIVSEAKQDVELNKAIELAAKYDPNHERTIRVLTKFDNFDTPETKDRAVRLIREGLDLRGVTNGSHLNLGPHAIISIDDEGKLRTEERGDEEEKKQLVDTYKVPESRAGIVALKNRLPPLFATLIKRNLPQLKKKVYDSMNETHLHLAKVGKEPLSPAAVTFRCYNFLKKQVNELETRLTHVCILQMKEHVNKVKGKLTFEEVTSSFKPNALHVILFQGKTEFEAAADIIRELWEPIINEFIKKTKEVVLESTHCLRDDKGTRIFGQLISVIQHEYQQHMQEEVFPKFSDACITALDDERFYATTNHYFDSKFREDEICPPELVTCFGLKAQALLSDSTKSRPHSQNSNYRMVHVSHLQECLEEAKAEVAAKDVHTDLMENQKKRLFAAVKAHFDVEKKTFVDVLLKKTKGILVLGHTDWIEKHFLRSDKIFEAAKEDECITKLRINLNDKICRLEECMMLLHDVPLQEEGS